MAVTTARFLTSGMHCSSCSMLVDMTLADLQGVLESKTDHATGVSMVTFDTEVVSADEVVGAILSAGYEAEIVSD